MSPIQNLIIKNFFMKSLITALCSTVLLLMACQKASGPGLKNAANISIYLTDDPSIQVQNLFVDIQRVEVKVEDDGVDSLGGWFNLNVRSGVYDILRFKNGIDTLFATGQIPAGRKLQKLRLTLGNNNRVVIGGATIPLSLHNNESQIIIKLDESTVDVIGGGDIRFWLDFDAGRSVQQKGNQFVLRSQLKAFSKGRSGEIEGRVAPADARAMIMAINGSDTAMATPDGEGEFKLIGLNSGTYQLLIHPTANNYRDTTINNVVVTKGEDTKVGTIQLSK